jgi:hypothetical protein
MALPQIPVSILQQSDRKAVFAGIRNWMQQEMSTPPIALESTTPSGAATIDQALGGGYPAGRITEIVEPHPSRGVQSLIHHAIAHARRQPQYVALIDAPNHFDPQSESAIHLQCLLWVRPAKSTDIPQACDILIRDGNFPLLLLDLRCPQNHRPTRIHPNDWYRLQRVCEQSHVAFVCFTATSTIPCAHFRLQLSETLPMKLIEEPTCDALPLLNCDILKRRHWVDGNTGIDPAPPALKTVNARITGA